MKENQLTLLALDVLELLGNDAPSQRQIDVVESLLIPHLKSQPININLFQPDLN